MNKYDQILSTIETIGTTNPVMNESGALNIAPTHKPAFDIDPKIIAEAKARKGEYDVFFEAVNSIGGGSDTKSSENIPNGIESRVKAAFTEAISYMEDESFEYWTTNVNVIEACRKLKPIMTKIVGKI